MSRSKKPKHRKRKAFMITFVILLILLLAAVIAAAAYIKYAGTPVPRPNIPRQAQTLGGGGPLTYVVMGDSTAVSQGGDYQKGYAVQSARHIAKTNKVTWINLAVPGARAQDIPAKQLPEAPKAPDVVLIAVGANDVTHFSAPSDVTHHLKKVIQTLREQNAGAKIVLTGSPDMGSVPRFPQPVRWFAGVRTTQLNKEIKKLAKEQNVVFAPIAEKTGPTFRKHPELFAADKFHPTTAGYELWTPIIIQALEDAGA